MDGVDAALVEVEGIGLEMEMNLVQSFHQPYPNDLRNLILQSGLEPKTSSLKHVSLLHRLLGEAFSVAAIQVADQAGVPLPGIQSIGCAGHTVWHEPDSRYPSSLTLGMATVIAEKTGVTTVTDFRTRDLVLGGQGLPLTSIIDYLLFHNFDEDRVLVNLGGIASLVYIPKNNNLRSVLGFQAGPCNSLLDGFISKLTGGREAYDAWGKHAVQGRCQESLLQRWLALPFFQRKPPKSLPLLEFGEEFIQQALKQAQTNRWSVNDLLCTASHLVASGIVMAIRRFLPRKPDRLLLGGGGVQNGFLWQLLEQQMDGIPLQKIDELGIPNRARKAVGYGGLAALLQDCVPANLMAVTGASGSRLLGTLTPGAPGNWARYVAWMSSQTAALAAA